MKITILKRWRALRKDTDKEIVFRYGFKVQRLPAAKVKIVERGEDIDIIIDDRVAHKYTRWIKYVQEMDKHLRRVNNEDN